MSSNVFKATGKTGKEASPLVFEKLKERRVSQRRAADRDLAAGGAENAYKEAFQEGEKAGFEAGMREAARLCGSLEAIIAEIGEFKKRLFNDCETEAVQLTMSIAGKVIQRELSMKEDSVVYVVKAALKAAVTNGKILIRLSPGDLDTINGFGKELQRYTKGFSAVTIEGDESVSRGGCIIETASGEVDATIEGLLDEVAGVLKDS
ncbi:MAG: FliH/SctL family protein [Thermodesulfobacteriota bacterium]